MQIFVLVTNVEFQLSNFVMVIIDVSVTQISSTVVEVAIVSTVRVAIVTVSINFPISVVIISR